ncbi:uncharacterized protein LOC109543212 [Dendroctonus ponderosae]|uniref:uncharacterized protein LOC109543212 n=1 Tax=Dendroctonus ponderosae TaxID=77166 RepID=UPI002034DD5C|nr:uncharacterized protein LOC109543212 [Dendroctonus ponderosae]
MIRKPQGRVQKSIRAAYARALRLILRPDGPHNAPSPFQFFNLLTLLGRPLDQIKLVEENVEFRTGATHRPHTFHIKVLLVETTATEPKEIHWNVIARVMGHIDESNKKSVNIRSKFEREILMYLTAFKSLDKFQRLFPAVGINYCDLFPICYGCAFSVMNQNTGRADHTAAILLQNLKASSYHFIPEPCDIALARLIVKRLALFHATPIAMAMQTINRYLHKLHSRMTGDIKFDPEYNASEEFEIISDTLYGDPELTQYLAAINHQLGLCAYNIDSNNDIENPAWTTICHRRCSIRKIMQRFQDGDDRERIKFVDTKYMEYDSCATDLLFFMLTSLTKAVLDKYFDDILQTYFSEFSRIMSIACIQLPEYTYQNFVTEFELRALSYMGPVFFEIRRIYFDGIFGSKPIRGMSYETKLKEVVSFVKDKGWLKRR